MRTTKSTVIPAKGGTHGPWALACAGTGGLAVSSRRGPVGGRLQSATRIAFAFLVTLAALLSQPGTIARAASLRPGTVALEPADGSVAIRTYGLGLLPFDGRFAAFHGTLRYNPSDHANCRVALQVDVASLAMSTDTITATVLGQDFLDAAHYPALNFAGTCNPNGLNGQLTMHGVTRPLALTLDWGSLLVARGRLRRADWGMTARPLLGGRTVRITVTVRLPDQTLAPAR